MVIEIREHIELRGNALLEVAIAGTHHKAYLSDYQNMAQAREEIGHFIDVVYQHKRIHSALGYLTPAEFEAQWQQNTPSNSTFLCPVF